MALPNEIHPFAIAGGGNQYQVANSLRFRASATAYLNRTFGTPTNNKIFTWSGWVKRGALGASQMILSGGDGSSNNDAWFGFNASDQIIFNSNTGGVYKIQVSTSAVFRDPSSWYSIVLFIDNTQATNSNGIKIYVNGVLQTLTYTTWVQNAGVSINTANVHYIGRLDYSAVQYLDGYLAEVNFIDGFAYDPSYFGQTDSITGIWQPKKYTGTYGTNGFYLPFTNNSSAPNLGYDYSPGSYSLNLREAGTNIGNMTDSGGLAGAFDGIVNNAVGSAGKVNGTDNSATPKIGGYVGKDWGSGNTKTITGFIFRTPTGEWVNNQTTGTTITITLQGSSDNSTWTDLGSGTFTDVSTGTSLVKSTGLTATAYRYHRIKIESSGTFNGGGCRCGELELYESGSYGLNSWQVNNISVTSGVTYDSMIDSPTAYDDGGNGRGNYAVLNPINGNSGTFSAANLQFVGPTNWSCVPSTILIPSTGKWFVAATFTGSASGNTGGGEYAYLGVAPPTVSKTAAYNSALGLWIGDTGWVYNFSATGSNSGSSFSVNNEVLFAVDRDANTYAIYKNGSSVATGTIGTTSGADLMFVYGSYSSSFGQMALNFGQRPFSYTPPAGFKALNSYNLANPSLPLV